MKKPTLREKVEQYEKFLHLLNLGITCNNNKMVQDLVSNADNWSYAHRVGNGELSEIKQEKIIRGCFWRLCDYNKIGAEGTQEHPEPETAQKI